LAKTAISMEKSSVSNQCPHAHSVKYISNDCVYNVQLCIPTCAQKGKPDIKDQVSDRACKGETHTSHIGKNNCLESGCLNLGREPFRYGSVHNSLLPWDLRYYQIWTWRKKVCTMASDFESICVCKCQTVENSTVLYQQRLQLSHWKSFLSQGCPEGKKSVPHPHQTADKNKVCVIAASPCFGVPHCYAGVQNNSWQNLLLDFYLKITFFWEHLS